VFEAMDAPALVHDPARPVAAGEPPHALSLHGVWASYPGSGHAALRGVDLQLTPGRRVALVGPSGAGKSTLADVMVRFLPADAGQVTLDGVSLERHAADDVRRVVGLVEQRAHLFDTSLAENLRVGRRTATDEELTEVLNRVGLGPWLDGLPDGLATAVGSLGGRLSGGQSQRVAVARALLADFPVLVLDEPGEHLDPPAADALTADLLALTEGRATLLITHRLIGLEQVDEIVLLDGGRVIERGSHTALVAAGGRYASLWWEERLNDQPADPDPDPGHGTRVITEGSEQP
jgi:ABC-type multidrug transport system fused ATPase/permease subunit